MIYTITFNPSLDYVVEVDNLELGKVNRTTKEKIYPGGKGINVSIVLKNLGIDSVALGYIAGFTGEEIEKKVKDFGCCTKFIKLKEGLSRINVKVKSQEESEINGVGPNINKEEVDALFKELEVLKEEDILVLAGSIPTSLPDDIYERIMEKFQGKNIKIIVDATKNLLLNVLKYKPFLIKPNNHELEEIFNVNLRSNEEIIIYGRKLQEMGARNVLISMAGDGAILIKEGGDIAISKVPKGVVKNSVGAGDSMVAGFIAGFTEGKDLNRAFKMGVATGSASAFSEGLAKKEKVLKLLDEIN